MEYFKSFFQVIAEKMFAIYFVIQVNNIKR